MMDDGFLGKTPPEKIFRSESSASGGLLDPLMFIDFSNRKNPLKIWKIASLQIAKCFNTHFEVTSRSDLEDTKIRVIYEVIFIYIYTRILIHIERESLTFGFWSLKYGI